MRRVTVWHVLWVALAVVLSASLLLQRSQWQQASLHLYSWLQPLWQKVQPAPVKVISLGDGLSPYEQRLELERWLNREQVWPGTLIIAADLQTPLSFEQQLFQQQLEPDAAQFNWQGIAGSRARILDALMRLPSNVWRLQQQQLHPLGASVTAEPVAVVTDWWQWDNRYPFLNELTQQHGATIWSLLESHWQTTPDWQKTENATRWQQWFQQTPASRLLMLPTEPSVKGADERRAIWWLQVGDASSGQGALNPQALAAVLSGRLLVEPAWAPLLELAGLLLFPLLLLFTARYGMASNILTALALALLFVSIQLLVAASLQLSVMLMPVALLSLAVVPLAAGIRRRNLWHLRVEEQQQVLRLQLAESWLEQNRTNKVFELLQQGLIDEPSLNMAYQAGLQCERQRDYTLAERIYDWLLAQQSNFRDCQKRKQSLKLMQSPLEQTRIMDATQVMPMEGLQMPTLGRYQIERVIGSGAMGVVYEAVDPKLNRPIALKTLSLSRQFGARELEEARMRFFREAETAGRLKHPNIVTVYDAGEEDDLAYIAMDLLTGAPLSEFVQADKLLPPSLVYQLVLQVAQALDYAHQQGVVHRDIKPANVVYDDERQQVIVTDFGIACVSDQSQTKTGTVLGSPFYMSPEQLLGQKVDGRSDVFSLGVTFYQLLTGTLPFKGDNIASLAYSISNQKHPNVREHRKDLPASSTRIINKALQKNRTKRYQQVSELVADLQRSLKRDYKVNLTS